MVAQTPKRADIGHETALLSDLQILERLVAHDRKCVFVSPLINPRAQLGPSSLDVHLGTEICFAQTINRSELNLTASKAEIGSALSSYITKRSLGPDETFVLHPREFVLGATLEFVRLPKDIAARIEGRSSLGRVGLQVHATAGYVDPGFEGTLTFELINAGSLPLRILPGLRIAQLCFFKLQEVEVGYTDKEYSKYSGFLGAEVSRISDDPEIPAVAPPV